MIRPIKFATTECPMGAVLNSQLQSVMQEGLLDSLLPYLVRDKKLYKVTITRPWSFPYQHSQPTEASSESDSPGAGFFPLSAMTR